MTLKPGLLWVPAQEMMLTECVRALMPVVDGLMPGSVVRIETDGCTLAAKRNNALACLQATPGLRWVLLLDSDMLPPGDVLLQLHRHARPIVGALCFQRKPPYAACVHVDGPFRPDGKLQEVEAVGAGCLLIQRTVFEQLPRGPWFVPNEADTREDINFCAAARAAGLRVYVDTGCVVGHVHPMAVTDRFPPRAAPVDAGTAARLLAGVP